MTRLAWCWPHVGKIHLVGVRGPEKLAWRPLLGQQFFLTRQEFETLAQMMHPVNFGVRTQGRLADIGEGNHHRPFALAARFQGNGQNSIRTPRSPITPGSLASI
ncbi:MAG: hypothetical protein JWL59_5178 [Chthoniobacteraceae bacterium]|nr:hypothetical protein [Chthoniobacteraceae bacterium]